GRVGVLHPFPTRRSSDLDDVHDGSAGVVAGGEVDESDDGPVVVIGGIVEDLTDRPAAGVLERMLVDEEQVGASGVGTDADARVLDRKSTRLNSSHVKISY